MSAPVSHDPLVVHTRDGACWTRRTVTEGGIALYALADVCQCPEFVMATLAELAERGIVGSADVLPVPVGPEPQAPALSGPICSQAEARAAGLDIAPSVEELDAMASTIVAAGDPLSAEVSLAQAVPLLGAAVTGQRARLAELEAAAYGDAEVRLLAPVEQIRHLHQALAAQLARAGTLNRLLREARAREAGPALPWAHTMPDDDLHGFLNDLVSAAMGRWQSSPEVPDREVLAAVEKACADWRTPGQGYRSDPEQEAVRRSVDAQFPVVAAFLAEDSDKPAVPDAPGTCGRALVTGKPCPDHPRPEAPPLTVWRASHDSIVMGLYTTAAEARRHCETEELRCHPALKTLPFAWTEEDGVADLVIDHGDEETDTGYVVTPLEVASEYDPGGAR